VQALLVAEAGSSSTASMSSTAPSPPFQERQGSTCRQAAQQTVASHLRSRQEAGRGRENNWRKVASLPRHRSSRFQNRHRRTRGSISAVRAVNAAHQYSTQRPHDRQAKAAALVQYTGTREDASQQRAPVRLGLASRYMNSICHRNKVGMVTPGPAHRTVQTPG
jgi:hypothetical protein